MTPPTEPTMSGEELDRARVAQSGPWAGNPIRSVRKAGKCADFRHCGTVLKLGDIYVQGDPQYDIAGGFGHERLCLPCAGISK